jgi:hypothetical protein
MEEERKIEGWVGEKGGMDIGMDREMGSAGSERKGWMDGERGR